MNTESTKAKNELNAIRFAAIAVQFPITFEAPTDITSNILLDWLIEIQNDETKSLSFIKTIFFSFWKVLLR